MFEYSESRKNEGIKWTIALNLSIVGCYSADKSAPLDIVRSHPYKNFQVHLNTFYFLNQITFECFRN